MKGGRTGRRAPAGLLLLMLVLGAEGGGARAAGLRDVGDGWLVPPDPDAGATAPAGAWLLVGGMRLHGMADLPVAGVAWGCGGGRPRLAMAWERTGRSLYREDAWRLRATWGRQRRVGVAWRAERLRLGDGPDAAAVSRTWGALLLGMTGELAAGSWSAEIHLPLADGNGPGRPVVPRPLAGLLLRGAGWSLAVRWDRSPAGPPRLGWGVQTHAGAVSAGLRGEPGTGAVGPVLVVRQGAVLIRTAHVAHPTLGVTHRLQVGWGAVGNVPW